MRRQRVDEARVVALVKVEYLYGDGTNESPLRRVIQYRGLDGELLAVQDPIHDRRPLYENPELDADASPKDSQ